jgi:hypothetical protein
MFYSHACLHTLKQKSHARLSSISVCPKSIWLGSSQLEEEKELFCNRTFSLHTVSWGRNYFINILYIRHLRWWKLLSLTCFYIVIFSLYPTLWFVLFYIPTRINWREMQHHFSCKWSLLCQSNSSFPSVIENFII